MLLSDTSMRPHLFLIHVEHALLLLQVDVVVCMSNYRLMIAICCDHALKHSKSHANNVKLGFRWLA